MEFKKVVKNRYSCKKFSDRQVEGEKLAAILEAGRLAPTAKNLQEQHVYVLQSADALAKVDAVTPCRYGAPTVLVVAFDAPERTPVESHFGLPPFDDIIMISQVRENVNIFR